MYCKKIWQSMAEKDLPVGVRLDAEQVLITLLLPGGGGKTRSGSPGRGYFPRRSGRGAAPPPPGRWKAPGRCRWPPACGSYPPCSTGPKRRAAPPGGCRGRCPVPRGSPSRPGPPAPPEPFCRPRCGSPRCR